MVRNWQKTNNTGTWGGDWNVYTYDALNRLVREKEMDTGLTITYGYDSLGNKTLEQDSRDNLRYTYIYFLPAGVAVVLLTGLFYNRPAADTATPAAAGTEGQGISEEAIETETIAAQSEHETSETGNEPIAAEESKTSDIECLHAMGEL